MSRPSRKYLILFLATALNACLFPHEKEDTSDHLVIPSEDSSIAGLEVLSFFNKGVGKEWKIVFGKGRLEDEPNSFISGPKSARLIAVDSNSTVIEKILSPPVNMCGDMNISLKVSAPSQTNLTSIFRINITLIGGSDLTHTASFNFRHLVREIYLMHPLQWLPTNMSVRTFFSTPNFDCSKVGRVRISLNAAPGMEDTLNLGQLSFFPSPLESASLLITEDDEWTDFEVNGIPAMRKHGFPGTIYANGGLAGTGSKMSIQSLRTLQDSGGWTIANHLWVHDSITNLSNDSAARSIRHNAEFLRSQGFTGYSHLAYPYGLVDPTKDSVVRSICSSARLVVGWPQGEPIPFSDPYRIRVLGFLSGGASLDLAKLGILLLVKNHTAGILGVHEIVANGPLDGNKWLRSDWEALMDFIQIFVDQGTLKIYSLEGFHKKYHEAIP